MNWKKISTKTMYENAWIKVLEDQVINPNGKENKYGHIQFKKIAVGIVPLDNSGNTWLVGQDRYTLDEYSWEIPMGGSEKNESLVSTAHRELAEETGIKANSMEKLMEIHTSNSLTNEIGHVFIAKDLNEGVPNFDDTEKLKIQKLPISEVVTMILHGDITDAITIAAILRVHLDLI